MANPYIPFHTKIPPCDNAGEDNTSLNYVQCNIALALIVCLEQWMSGPPTHSFQFNP